MKELIKKNYKEKISKLYGDNKTAEEIYQIHISFLEDIELMVKEMLKTITSNPVK